MSRSVEPVIGLVSAGGSDSRAQATEASIRLSAGSVAAPETFLVITPGFAVPVPAVSESRSAGHNSVRIASIRLVSDGSDPAESE